jgi:hypothetical protein
MSTDTHSAIPHLVMLRCRYILMTSHNAQYTSGFKRPQVRKRRR